MTVREQEARVYEAAVVTPLERADALSALLQNNIYLKREDTQAVHSFKIRGAYNKIVQLSPEERQKGIIAASAGNHAQGVAYSAQKLGITATIVMPRTTPSIKINAVRSYGAEIILEGDNYSEAYEACQRMIGSSGKVFIHPFNDPAVIAGQGTVGREICDQLPDVNYIFVPIGGGGLIAGIAQYVKQSKPDVRIIGVEPQDSNAMQASIAAGHCVTLPHVGVFADGVAVKYVGNLTFELCRQYVDEIMTVTNDQISAAIKNIFEETRGIVEPAGALSAAGAVQYIADHKIRDKNIVTISSGANMPFEKLQYVAERTLLGSGKEALYQIELSETPGALAALCTDVINDHSITEFNYRMTDRKKAYIFVGISIRDMGDKDRLERSLQKYRYTYQDVSGDDIAKEHIRHMIGGVSSVPDHEHLYEISFPERPRALGDFLTALGVKYNISLFHYRGQGGDTGSALIGFEAENVSGLESALAGLGYEYAPVLSKAAATFLQPQKSL